MLLAADNFACGSALRAMHVGELGVGWKGRMQYLCIKKKSLESDWEMGLMGLDGGKATFNLSFYTSPCCF